MRAFRYVVAVVAFSCTLFAQQSTNEQVPAHPEDVRSIDAIVKAVYDVISGPASQKRDWDRMRTLFVPDARLIPTSMQPSGKMGLQVLSLDGYISRSDPILQKQSFFENEIARRIEQFGNIAHVWSTYESRHNRSEKPFARGINSIQLFNDGQRWWIVNIFWQAESPQHPLPQKYLARKKQN